MIRRKAAQSDLQAVERRRHGPLVRSFVRLVLAAFDESEGVPKFQLVHLGLSRCIARCIPSLRETLGPGGRRERGAGT